MDLSCSLKKLLPRGIGYSLNAAFSIYSEAKRVVPRLLIHFQTRLLKFIVILKPGRLCTNYFALLCLHRSYLECLRYTRF